MKDPEGFAFALILISLIGGCTYALTSESDTAKMRTCINAGNDWKSGDCVKPQAVRP
jgi:hypothetical protein